MASFCRPRTLSEITRFVALGPVENHFIPGGKVTWASYHRLRRDFPFLEGADEGLIDDWIVANFSLLSTLQEKLIGLRVLDYPRQASPIITYRSSADGRADTVRAEDLTGAPAGLLSRKGAGTSEQRLARNFEILESYRRRWSDEERALDELRGRWNTNGVLREGDAIKELVVMEALQAAYDLLARKGHPAFETVESYFLLQLPVEVLRQGLPTSKAVILGRQANFGRLWCNHLPEREHVNAKQMDFTGTMVDGGTVRVGACLLPPASAYLDEYFMVRNELVGGAVIDELATNPRAIAGLIESLTASLQAMLAPLPPRRESSLSMGDAVDRVSRLLLEAPHSRASLADVLVHAQRQGNGEVLNRPISQEVMRALLSVDPALMDESYADVYGYDATPGEVPLLRWGLVLLPSLADRAWSRAFLRRLAGTYPHHLDYLREELVLLPPSRYRAELLATLGALRKEEEKESTPHA